MLLMLNFGYSVNIDYSTGEVPFSKLLFCVYVSGEHYFGLRFYCRAFVGDCGMLTQAPGAAVYYTTELISKHF